jgi:hypothetical protein
MQNLHPHKIYRVYIYCIQPLGCTSIRKLSLSLKHFQTLCFVLQFIQLHVFSFTYTVHKFYLYMYFLSHILSLNFNAVSRYRLYVPQQNRLLLTSFLCPDWSISYGITFMEHRVWLVRIDFWHHASSQFHNSVIQNAPDKLTVFLSPTQGNRVPF